MHDRAIRFWLGVFLCSFVALVALLGVAFAQEEHRGHKPEHMELHNQFYSTWMMPDNRAISCCHDEDCEPAEAHQENGVWYARKVSEAESYPEYIRIPENKVERDRDSPDGRSHICGRRYGFSNGNMSMSVFCFLPAGGS